MLFRSPLSPSSLSLLSPDLLGATLSDLRTDFLPVSRCALPSPLCVFDRPLASRVDSLRRSLLYCTSFRGDRESADELVSLFLLLRSRLRFGRLAESRDGGDMSRASPCRFFLLRPSSSSKFNKTGLCGSRSSTLLTLCAFSS